MSVITVVHDYKMLLMAHHVERSLNSEGFAELRENFRSTDDSDVVPFSVFFHCIGLTSKRLPEETQRTLFKDSDIRQWFSSLDDDYDGLVAFSQLLERLALAASMRRYPILYQPKIKVTRWENSSAERLIWVDAWRRLAVCSSTSSEVELLSSSGTRLSALVGHTAPTLNGTFLRPIGRLCTVGIDRNLIIWDHKRLQPYYSTLLEHPAGCITYDTEENAIIVARLDGVLQSFTPDLAHCNWTSKAKHDDWIRDILYIAELRCFVTASLDRTIGFWTYEGELLNRKTGHTRNVTCLAYSTGTRTLFSGGQGKEILAWNPFSPLPTPIAVLHGHEREILGIFADRINRCIVSVDPGTRVVVWDAAKFTVICRVESAEAVLHQTSLKGVCMNPVSRELMMAAGNNQFFRATAEIPETKPKKLGHRLNSMQLSSEFKVVVCTTVSSVLIFGCLEGELLRSIESPFSNTVAITGSSLSKDQLFIHSDDGRVIQYQLEEGVSNITRMRPKRILHIFDSAVSLVWPCKQGLCFLEKAGTLSLHSAKVESTGIFVGLVNSVVIPDTVCCHCSINGEDQELLALGKERGILLYKPSKGQFQEIVTPVHRRETVSMIFSEARSALIVLFKNGEVVVYNIGSFTECLIVTDLVGILTEKANQLQRAPVRLLDRRGSFRRLSSAANAQQMVTIHAVRVGLLKDDIIVLGSEAGLVTYIPLTDHYTKFLSTQKNATFAAENLSASGVPNTSIGAVEGPIPIVTSSSQSGSPRDSLGASQHDLGSSTMEGPIDFTRIGIVHNTHFVLTPALNVGAQRSLGGITSRLFYGTDRRSNTPIIMKCYLRESDHDAEIRIRQQLMQFGETAPTPLSESSRLSGGGADEYFVQCIEHWRSNEGMSPGTVPRAIVMERGATILRDLISPSERGKRSPLSTVGDDERDRLMIRLLDILRAVHEAGLVSSDLRPKDLVLVDGEWKLCGLNSLIPKGSRFGIHHSPSYCPPEHSLTSARPCEPAPTADGKANVWSLGVLCYEIITGAKLFDGPNPMAILSTITAISQSKIDATIDILERTGGSGVSVSSSPSRASPTILGLTSSVARHILRRCLHKDPSQRPTASELLEELNQQILQATTSTSSAGDRRASLKASNAAKAPGQRQKEPMMLPLGLPPNARPTKVNAKLIENLTVVPLMQAGEIVFLAAESRNQEDVVVSADAGVGDGSLHLLVGHGTQAGQLPRSEIGEDPLTTWAWPTMNLRGSRKGPSPSAAAAGADADESLRNLLGAETQLAPVDGEHAKHAKSIPCGPELHPPKGWRGMSEEELAETLTKEAPPVVDEKLALDRFVQNIVGNSSFFGLGPKDGESIPMFTAGATTRMSSLQLAELRSSRADSDKQKRIEKFLKAMHQDLGLKGNPLAYQHAQARENAKQLMAARVKPTKRHQERAMMALMSSTPVPSETEPHSVQERYRTVDAQLLVSPERERLFLKELAQHPRLEMELEQDLFAVRASLSPSRSQSPQRRVSEKRSSMMNGGSGTDPTKAAWVDRLSIRRSQAALKKTH
jgi:WD40 repeat protein